MAMLSSISASFHRLACSSPSTPIPLVPSSASLLAKSTSTSSRNRVYLTACALEKPIQFDIEEETEMVEEDSGSETVLYSISPHPILLIVALPVFGKFAILFQFA
ncbi:hypothetical protein L2E82_39456 [Cichorium intybus]|uniref:Uncharacterized protein n=1 Tax=Cichorium intybus TaxID=13427 RepID=A0ACB9AMM3_CICIN|nr:hypothetical protein L2E82_39456 [Cichorium intybus]